MAVTRIIDAIVQLRRDNDYNYERVKTAFIPKKGEVCLIDTSNMGLRAKVGDGTTVFANLPYTDESIATNLIIRGYIHNDEFYSDASFTTLVEPSVNKIYIDVVGSTVYIYNGTKYIPINQGGNGVVSMATAETAGIMKLYDTIGQETDGTMTQKAISDELGDKVEISTDDQNELLTFTFG